MTVEERKELYILVLWTVLFFLLFEQGDLHSCFVWCPVNYVVGLTQVVCRLRFNWVGLKRVLRSPDVHQVACQMQTPNRYLSVCFFLEPSLKQRIDQIGSHVIVANVFQSFYQFKKKTKKTFANFMSRPPVFSWLIFSPIMCAGPFTF